MLGQSCDVGVDDGVECFIGDVEEFHESSSGPFSLFGLGVEDYGVASANVVAVEGLESIDFVLLGSSGSQ